MDFLNHGRDESRLPTFYTRCGPVGRTLIEAVALLIVAAGLGTYLHSLSFGQVFLASDANVRAIGALLGAPPKAPAPETPFDGDLQQWLEHPTTVPVPGSSSSPSVTPTAPTNLDPAPSRTPRTSVNLGLLAIGLAVGILVFPLLEELVFRGLPLLGLRALQRRGRFDPQRPVNLFGRQFEAHWLIGVLAAMVFSVLHGIGDGGLSFPLPQFVAGLAFWWVALRRGLRYSILMHATYNLIPLGLMAVTVALT